MSGDKCDGCRFWRPEEGAERAGELAVGECRRHPPVINLEVVRGLAGQRAGRGADLETLTDQAHGAAGEVIAWRAPVTWGDFWCGDHQPKGAA